MTSKTKELIVLQTHVDYNQKSNSLDSIYPTITIYGKTLDEIPIQIKIDDFAPYFYARPLLATSTEINLNENVIEEAFKRSFDKGKCMGVEKMLKTDIYGFTNKEQVFYKIMINTPSLYKAAREVLQSGLIINGKQICFKTYESNFPFVLRFMHDINVTGVSYIKINSWTEIKNTNETEDDNKKTEHTKFKQKECYMIKTSYTFIEALPLEGNWIKVIPQKVLSFDIECCGETDSFPSALTDPVIQIGNTIKMTNDTEVTKVIFCLKETVDLPGATVFSFDKEEDLLMAWTNFIQESDPDIILGYNIKNFDFPYLLERAEVLQLKDFSILGRTDRRSKVFKKTQQSSNFGSIETSDITIEGRMLFDLFHILKREHKLRSYSLNSVSVHFLNEQKEDVPYSSIYGLQNGTKETRGRIASYCLKDTLLPLRIFDKLNTFINYVELSRATHVPIEYFSTRGTSIKVLSLIYREASRLNFVIPDMEIKDTESSFEGAFVMDPLKGFYETPIAVLDFCSLYPSIMISQNLCYTTLLPKSFDTQEFKEGDVTTTPTGDRFISKNVKEGLLPRILTSLLKNRKETKKQLKEAKEEWLKKSLDGRQLALKICANSIYGFTGAQVGQLPCLEISQSTTAFGREMIAKTKKMIETKYSIKEGFTHDVVVIYGDTDSVMLNFNEKNIKLVFELANKIAEYVSSTFVKPVALEFEKVYSPYLLMNKKRYAGLIYTNSEKADKIDTKGIETVRRDNCELVKTIIDKCLKLILYDLDVVAAANFVKQKVNELYCDQIDLSQLIISKTYTKTNYAVKSAHVNLVEKLKERGNQIRIGDRIPYVIVSGDKRSKIYDKAEDPLYVLENNLPIDTEYYIENQLSKPIKRLFEPIMDNVGELFQAKKIVKNAATSGALNKFLIVKEMCIGCKQTNDGIVCSNCMPLFPKHYNRAIKEYNNKINTYHLCWAECQRCMGSIMNEVICVNKDCPIFYTRTKIKKGVEEMQKKIDKLNELKW